MGFLPSGAVPFTKSQLSFDFCSVGCSSAGQNSTASDPLRNNSRIPPEVGVVDALRGVWHDRLQIFQRANRGVAGQAARAVVVQHLAAVREDEAVENHDRVLALVSEEADAKLAVGRQLRAGGLEALEGREALRIDLGGLEQIGVVIAEAPDVDVERDAPEVAAVVG